jgi:hypothetical protein
MAPYKFRRPPQSGKIPAMHAPVITTGRDLRLDLFRGIGRELFLHFDRRHDQHLSASFYGFLPVNMRFANGESIHCAGAKARRSEFARHIKSVSAD